MTTPLTEANKSSETPVSANWSRESEELLLVAALDESRAGVIQLIAAQLLHSDFFEPAHQNLWQCRGVLADAGVAHDLSAIMDSAKRLNLFVGGAEYVVGLRTNDAMRTASDLALNGAAKRVKDYSILRTVQETLQTSNDAAIAGTQPYEEIMEFVEDSFSGIRKKNDARARGAQHVMHYVSGVIEQVEMRMSGSKPDNVVGTGFGRLDMLTGGMSNGELIVLAARPSMGKTAISLAIAGSCSTEGGYDVLFFGTEQGGIALTYRLISSSARIDSMAVKRGELPGDDFSRFAEGASQVGNMRLYIDETSELTLPELRARARTFRAQQPDRKMLVIVDYLQNLSSHRRGQAFVDTRVVVGEIATGLKRLAKELNCPVLALAQLSRTLESRVNKRPIMSDLAESGKIEQDADIIMFLYRDDYYNRDTKEPGITEVIVAKNRDGGTGMTKLFFERSTQHFQEI